MERIKALHARVSSEQRGKLNLIYMNALAELHNYGSRLGCDYRALTPPERTAFVRRVGKNALQNRRLIKTDCGIGAAADVFGTSVLPHIAALELLDWIEILLETVIQSKIPIRLKPDRDTETFYGLLQDIAACYPQVELQLETASEQIPE